MTELNASGQLNKDVAEKHLSKHAAKKKKRKKKKPVSSWRKTVCELFKKDVNKHYQTGRQVEAIAKELKELQAQDPDSKPGKRRRPKKRRWASKKEAPTGDSESVSETKDTHPSDKLDARDASAPASQADEKTSGNNPDNKSASDKHAPNKNNPGKRRSRNRRSSNRSSDRKAPDNDRAPGNNRVSENDRASDDKRASDNKRTSGDRPGRRESDKRRRQQQNGQASRGPDHRQKNEQPVTTQ